MAISPTNASRCWKKGDFGAVWDGCVVGREAMVLGNRRLFLDEQLQRIWRTAIHLYLIVDSGQSQSPPTVTLTKQGT